MKRRMKKYRIEKDTCIIFSSAKKIKLLWLNIILIFIKIPFTDVEACHNKISDPLICITLVLFSYFCSLNKMIIDWTSWIERAVRETVRANTVRETVRATVRETVRANTLFVLLNSLKKKTRNWPYNCLVYWTNHKWCLLSPLRRDGTLPFCDYFVLLILIWLWCTFIHTNISKFPHTTLRISCYL